uniref:NADH-ubiquinone oxidoreductase chain 2 n=1 Tax=Lepidoblepharon ophthalmolepis TaxID=195621 RepID=A0A090AST3_9PLEU|nr:NADH dehydrogenase subunit 2 [Lepidoblepharon ophthalmolepis]BAP58965.1 NADH dehydrogenase subunit 2 [Lepidoblepharon ophthalmolepis]
MHPYILTTLLFALGLGTTITFASSHWLLAWMGLEINTLAILPLMTQPSHPRAVEAATKYFLVQSTATAVLLFASTTNAWLTGQWAIQQMAHPLPTTMAVMALAFKLGLAPMHAWLPEVLQGLNLTTGLILSTWQKLAPFILLLQMQSVDPAIPTILGLSSILVGGWGGLNQTQLRKILAYSSIAHFGWMLLIFQFSPHLALLALLTYFIMTTPVFLVSKLYKATTINMLAISSMKNPIMTGLMPLVLLSLGGLPPLTGFVPKWLILQELAKQELITLATLAALTSLLSLYFYLRLSYTMTLTMSPNNTTGLTPWRFYSPQLMFPLAATTTATILFLPLTPAMVALLMP